ncbi:DinB family protein [Phycisphaeraceae bacterium D3-23]
MNEAALMSDLTGFPAVLSAAVAGLSDAQFRWKPASGAYSILEVVCHLADEEVEDFALRLRLTLEDPTQDWPKIDPANWAQLRKHNEQDPAESLARFTKSRADNMLWLASIRPIDWETTHPHPLGDLKAADLFASWAAHDWLHLRQITKRRYELCTTAGSPYDALYAGEWSA